MLKSRAEKIFLFVSFLVVGAVFVSKTLAIQSIHGQDFLAYRLTAQRFWAGENPYVPGDYKAYKYAPTLLLLFSPLAWGSEALVLWIFAAVNFCAVLALPWLALRAVRSDAQLAMRPRDIVTGLSLGLVASLRFIDGEAYNAQINALSLCFIWTAVGMWTSSTSRRSRWGAAALYTLGAFFKFHPFLGWGVFVRQQSWRTLLLLVVCVFALACVPSLTLWRDLRLQLESTTPLLVSSVRTYVYQGFYGVSGNFFGLDQRSKIPFLVFIPIAAAVIAALPKFDLFAAGRSPRRAPASFAAAVGALLLLAVTSSPLSWQHTYILWAALVPLAYVIGNARERKLVMVLALVMGLSARGIAGRWLSETLEIYQSIFILSLALVGVLVHQARRYRIKF
ncbi:MAG: DUF2029 domain-containing protein [Bdellovibrionales bacterium]|nr:DUF2029 domain-containing protein [Bdellovibrionales bacterium]